MAKQRPSLNKAVFLAILALSCTVAIISFGIAGLIYQKSQIDDAYKTLAGEIDAIEDINEGNIDATALSQIQVAGTRVTLIAKDGSVLYDSLSPAKNLPNHLDRPEVKDALELGVGKSERSSSTLDSVSIYYAQRLSSGEVLRLSTDRSALTSIFIQNAMAALFLLIILIILSYLCAKAFSKNLVAPILNMDLEEKTKELESPYVELDPLVKRIEDQQQQLKDQVEDLKELHAMRRQFSANITHELKTPIASIMGASELIKDGICQPKDVPDFATRIHKEATRLSSLVNDILMLSKLDESERSDDSTLFGEAELVDLYTVAEDVLSRYSAKAKRQDIKLHLKGSHAYILGYPKLLDELISNLLDNAIRYNKAKGEVFVRILPQDEKVTLSVADTGIGIAKEHETKVFERFWRADTSRSRGSGGTGLGLAIVKHAASFHGAKLTLDSNLGEGTTICVSFKKYMS